MSVSVYSTPTSLAAFFTSDKFISLVVGPVGSTKTTAGIIKIAYHAAQMAPCQDGIRRSRVAWVRRSRQILYDTSIKDFLSWYPDGAAGSFHKTDSRFVLKFDDVECEVLFRPMEDESDINRLLSLQLSFAVFDEFREISPAVYEAMQGRLGRYPDKKLVPPRPEWGVDADGHPIGGCVDENGKPMKLLWGMTNPPDFDTYFERLLSNPPSNVHVTIQPSGMSPEADWVKWLPSGYYADLMEGKSQDYIDVYVHSKFGRSLSGQPVFRCFNRDTHVAKETLTPLPSPLIIGVDAGLNPTAVITQQTYDGRVVVLDAITGMEGGMGAVRFVRERLRPLLTNKYPNHQMTVIIDPAAFQRAQTDERTVADVFKAEGFVVKPARTNSIAARLAAGEKYMTKTVDGKAGLLICPGAGGLIKALAGLYRYKTNTKGETDVKPEKSHPHSDYCFVAGTPVLTPMGYVNIENLKVGDQTATYDGVDTVTAVGSRVVPALMELTLSDGTTLTCTPDHPFAVETHTCFLPAEELNSDHELVVKEGSVPLRVLKSSYVGSGRVYNITTSRTHLYYAGSLLVHNCDSFTYACLQHDGGSLFGSELTSARREIKSVSAIGWT